MLNDATVMTCDKDMSLNLGLSLWGSISKGVMPQIYAFHSPKAVYASDHCIVLFPEQVS